MDILSTAIISLGVCVAYDLVLKKWILPWVQSFFNKTQPPAQG